MNWYKRANFEIQLNQFETDIGKAIEDAVQHFFKPNDHRQNSLRQSLQIKVQEMLSNCKKCITNAMPNCRSVCNYGEIWDNLQRQTHQMLSSIHFANNSTSKKV